ncbi:MAG: ECF transporter S component [Eubacteriales bacterium]
MSNLVAEVMENAVFIVEFLGVVAGLFIVAYVFEKMEKRKQGSRERVLTTRKIAMIGVFSAIASILMLFEVPVPFAPPFYGIDLSEVPVLIGTFAFGPVAGVMMEFVKILLKVCFKPTSTAFVGELANFAVGCSFLLPASVVYLFRKNKKTAIISCVVGTLSMTIFGTLFNAVYLLPKFAQLYGMPLDTIIAMGTAVNPAIDSVTALVVLAVAPLNLLKGFLISLITILTYKKLSPIIKSSHK